MKIGIIGGGVSGLSLAYFLGLKNIDFTLFEKENILGGNAHTRKFILNGKEKWVDLAVNDFNAQMYSNLIKLMNDTESESGQVKVNTTFFSESNFLHKESDIKESNLLEEIGRFKIEAVEVLFSENYRWYSVEKYFEEKGYSKTFLTQYLYPRIQGLFFYATEGLGSIPVYFVMNFYSLQCGFQYNEPPQSIRLNFKSGSNTWIQNLKKKIDSNKIVTGVLPKIIKTKKGFVIEYSGKEISVEKIVFSCHADDILKHYSNIPDIKQKEILSSFKYNKMISVAHNDLNYLPINKDNISAYNCLVRKELYKDGIDYTITYNCNEHQNIDEDKESKNSDNDVFFVTVNPTREINEKYILNDIYGEPIIKEFYRNICDFSALRAQEQLKFHQGISNIYFTGGYSNGIGLHENCLQQSLKISELICP
jgi:predicted NAD/FAD-binding protein